MARPAAPSPRRQTDRTRGPYRARLARRELPAAFSRPLASDADTQPLLDRYAATGAEADRGAVITHMLSLVTALAAGPRARRRFASADLDELVSDGAMAVVDVVDRHAGLPADRFRRVVVGAVFGGFAQRLADRTWGGRSAAAHGGRLAASRRRYMRRHKRPPTTAELAAWAAAEADAFGPAADADRRRRMVAASSLADDAAAAATVAAADRGPTPDALAAGREAMALALAGLAGDDREMFRLAVEGVGTRAIAARFGLSHQAAYRRANGLLWQARCRADLARHLGVEPATFAPHYGGRGGGERGIGSVPPARLAV